MRGWLLVGFRSERFLLLGSGFDEEWEHACGSVVHRRWRIPEEEKGPKTSRAEDGRIGVAYLKIPQVFEKRQKRK